MRGAEFFSYPYFRQDGVALGGNVTRGSDIRSEQEQKIQDTLSYFDAREQGGRPIPARDVLETRFQELANGTPVPVFIFNCIDFVYQEGKPGEYPLAFPTYDVDGSIATFYQSQIQEIVAQMRTLGTPDVKILLPNSEFDTRVLNLPQSEEEIREYLKRTRTDLTDIFAQDGIEVIDLSDYLASIGLPSPYDYTAQNFARIRNVNYKLDSKHLKSSRGYFVKKGLSPDYVATISDEEVRERLLWYFAMYAGEGEALAQAKGIVVNLEDNSRVATWLQRGATNFGKEAGLPIVTPVDTKAYTSFREERGEKAEIL